MGCRIIMLFIMLPFWNERARRTSSTLSFYYRLPAKYHFPIGIKKGLSVRIALSSNGTWQCATLTWGNPTLPSPLIRFTSEFGMGSGGTVSLWLPGKTGCKLNVCVIPTYSVHITLIINNLGILIFT